MGVKPKNRGGRPRVRKPKEGQRITISVRVTPRLKALIDESARLSGRSLSQEAEHLLERSFDPAAPATEDHWLMVFNGMVRLTDVMTKVGDHMVDVANATKDPVVMKKAQGLHASVKAILHTMPKVVKMPKDLK